MFLDYVKQRLPTHTETEIREHEAWYQEYLFLNENKKCAIKKWRERKEVIEFCCCCVRNRSRINIFQI